MKKLQKLNPVPSVPTNLSSIMKKGDVLTGSKTENPVQSPAIVLGPDEIDFILNLCAISTKLFTLFGDVVVGGAKMVRNTQINIQILMDKLELMRRK